MKIAFVDSGVGGLTVATEFFEIMPEQEYIYYGDTLHLPYGPRPSMEVKNFSLEIIDFLISEKKADIVVIACHTASAVALDSAKNIFSKPIYGTVKAASKRAALITENQKVGIIGTEGTVKSKAYQNSLVNFENDLSVFAEACPQFVDFVEDGKLEGEKVLAYAKNCLKPLKKEEIDTLILGCTHFPYLSKIIKKVMGDEVELINPAVEMAKSVKANIIQKNDLKKSKDKTEKIDFMVSDKNNISTLFWNGKLVDKDLISLREVNIFK